MPRPAPVTTATRPSKLCSFIRDPSSHRDGCTDQSLSFLASASTRSLAFDRRTDATNRSESTNLVAARSGRRAATRSSTPRRRSSPRRGYHATGIAELCEVNGLGKGALYHYIGSKEELLAAIHDRVMDEVMVGADRVAEAGGSPSDAAGHAGRRAARRHPPLSRSRLGLPPRVPGAHGRTRRAVPRAPAGVRAKGRGGPAGRRGCGGVPRRRSVARRPGRGSACTTTRTCG